MIKNSPIKIALQDITVSIKRYNLVGMLGWQDLKQRYRRSALGPFWITISMAVMICTIGLVFGKIFKSPMQEFLPFLAIGMIVWNFASSAINEGCSGFIGAEGIIKQLPIPLFVHIMRLMWRNLLIFAHNIVILPIVFLAVGKSVGLVAFLSIPGLILASINLTWIALLLGVVCTRYRDLPQIIGNVLQVFFYLTPIMWMPSLLPQGAGMYLLDFNPAYHCLEIIRAPLLGHAPSAINWIASLVLAFFGYLLTFWIYGTYKRRIAYWL